MKHTSIFLLLLFFIVSFSKAQKQNLTLDEAVNKYYNYTGEYLNGVQWKGDTFTHIDRWTSIVEESINSKHTKVLLSVEELTTPFENAGLKAPYYINNNYKWRNNTEIELITEQAFVVFDCAEKKIINSISFPEGAKNIEISTNAYNAAYTLKNNLYITNTEGKTDTITNDTNCGIVNGDAYVHRQEFGINKGSFWSPDGSKLAFYRKDETMVDEFPLVDMSKNIAQVEKIKYPMAGEISEEVTIGVYNIKTKKTSFLKTGQASNKYLCSVTWGPAGKYIYTALLNRDQNHLQLNCYEAENGEFVKTLFEEKHEKYVEPENPLCFLNSKPDQFIWWSERDGYNHLYLYNTNGTLIKQITKGNFDVSEIIGTDRDDKILYYISTEISPLERHLFAININNTKKQQLTIEEGSHNVVMNNEKTFFIDSYSNINSPQIVNLKTTKNKIVRNILQSPDPFTQTKKGNISIITLKAADNTTDLYGRLILPPDFDSSKKYPAIIYVYGGPHLQQITNSWLAGAQLWQLYMAQQGYIMLTVDNRGTEYRGLEFENCTFKQLGIIEMQDQIKGVEYLKNLPFVDADRLGVHGWSFGGFMTIGMMTHYPEIFKAGVAGGPVTDWKYYEVMYGERYMDSPQSNPEGYKKTSLLHKAKSLKGRLLIIHGAMDPVVVWQNSLAFLRECVKNDIPVEYFPYPSHEHNIGGKDRYHLMKKITQYFDDFL